MPPFLPGDVVRIKDRIVSIVVYAEAKCFDRGYDHGRIIDAGPIRGDALLIVAVSGGGGLCTVVRDEVLGWIGWECVEREECT